MKEKIIVFGAGYIGQRIAESFGCTLSRIRIEGNLSKLRSFLDKEKPEVVISAIGKTGEPNIDWCEEHKLETIEGNIIATLLLADECSKMKIYFVHIGTGGIYSGDNNGNGFSETDEPNFYGPQFYAKVKILSEKLLSEFPCLQLRINLPLDSKPHERNLIDKLIKYPLISDAKASMTSLPDMLAALKILISKRRQGVYNTTNPGAISPAEIMQMYKEIVDSKHRLDVINSTKLDAITKARKSNCRLNTDKLQAEGIKLPEIHDAVRICLYKWKECKEPTKQSF